MNDINWVRFISNVQSEFEDIKGAIRIRISQKNKEHNVDNKGAIRIRISQKNKEHNVDNKGAIRFRISQKNKEHNVDNKGAIRIRISQKNKEHNEDNKGAIRFRISQKNKEHNVDNKGAIRFRISQKNRQHTIINVDNKGVIRKRISKRTDNTMAWPTVPNKKTNTDHQNTTQKTKDWATRTPLTTGDELGCSGRVCSSCSNSDIRHVPLVTNPVIINTYPTRFQHLMNPCLNSGGQQIQQYQQNDQPPFTSNH
jgi:hypothetical protein